jgi:uncharacterized protein (TIGR03435 family)
MSGSRVHFSRPRVITAVTSMIVGITLFIVFGCFSAIAQKPDRPLEFQQSTNRDQIAHPAFDVASIHPDNSDHTARTHIYSYSDQGHFIAINATLLQLLQYAYALPDSRILGMPEWGRSTKYDIEAKSDPVLVSHLAGLSSASAKANLLEMVQSLFRDRFHLTVHIDQRELPVFNLVVAKGGPNFAPAKNEGTTVDSGTHNGIRAIEIRSSSRAIAELAELLARYVGRVVIDRTGLQGNFTVGLRFSAEDPSSLGASPDPHVETGPSVYTALREQLGLELKSGKAPVDVLVIDHVEPPTEN